MSLSILIADDHFPVRFGLEILAREVLGNNTQIDFANDFLGIIDKIQQKKYDILISDIIMPGMDCMAMMKQALEILPKLKILFVSVHPKEIFAPRYMNAGAYGYVCKTDPDEELRKAIRHIYLGKKYFANIYADEKGHHASGKVNHTPFDLLSRREFSVMIMLLKGKGNIEIANALSLSPSTASTYRGRIFEKLKIRNLMELSNLARQYQIVIGE